MNLKNKKLIDELYIRQMPGIKNNEKLIKLLELDREER